MFSGIKINSLCAPGKQNDLLKYVCCIFMINEHYESQVDWLQNLENCFKFLQGK